MRNLSVGTRLCGNLPSVNRHMWGFGLATPFWHVPRPRAHLWWWPTGQRVNWRQKRPFATARFHLGGSLLWRCLTKILSSLITMPSYSHFFSFMIFSGCNRLCHKSWFIIKVKPPLVALVQWTNRLLGGYINEFFFEVSSTMKAFSLFLQSHSRLFCHFAAHGKVKQQFKIGTKTMLF